MPFPTYDKKTLLRFALTTMRNRMDVDTTPGSFWYRLAESWADVLVSASGHQKYIAAQVLPTTADTTTLERHARVRGISRKQAREAEGYVNVVLTEE